MVRRPPDDTGRASGSRRPSYGGVAMSGDDKPSGDLASDRLIDVYRSLADSTGEGKESGEDLGLEPELQSSGTQPPSTGGVSGIPGSPRTVFVPKTSTPLEEDDEGVAIPEAALWAMKYRRHVHIGLTRREEQRLRVKLAEGDEAVFAIDDGEKHRMVARVVGTD